MTQLPVVRSARAEDDLLEIWQYVARQNLASADRLLDQFEARWQLLGTQPYSGVARPDIASGVRHLVIGKYLSFYTVANDEITIVRVVHGHRNITSDDFET